MRKNIVITEFCEQFKKFKVYIFRF